MALPDLTGQDIEKTYQRIIHTGDGINFFDGTGSAVTFTATAVAGGSNTNIQFNSASLLSGSRNFSFDYVNNNVLLTGSLLVTQSYISTIDYIDFTKIPLVSLPPHNEGRLHWFDDTKTLQIDTDKNDFMIEIGHQNVVRVYNDTGVDIPLGKVVRISGSQGNQPTIVTSSWEDDSSSAATLGFAATLISGSGGNRHGYVVTNGLLRNVNTLVYPVGTQLYLSSSGNFTNTPPDAPLHEVRLGKVIVQNATTGIIYVDIMNGYELTELHDVKTTTYSNGDLLVQSGSLWINSKTLTGSYTLSGSLTTNDGVSIVSLTASFVSASSITGSLFGTASVATVAFSSSVVKNTTNGAILYPTLVNSSNLPAENETLYTTEVGHLIYTVGTTGGTLRSQYFSQYPTANYTGFIGTSSWAEKALTSSLVAVTEASNNTNYPVIFITSSYNSAGTDLYLNSSRLYYNPNLGTLTTTTYANISAGTVNPITSSWALTSSFATTSSFTISSSFASIAQNALTASIIATKITSNGTNHPVIFVTSSLESSGSVLNIDNNNRFYYNPGTSTLTAGIYANSSGGTINPITSSWAQSSSFANTASFTISASFANKAVSSSFVSTVENSNNANFPLTFVDSANATATYEQLYTFGTRLFYNPASSTLYSSIFSGDLTGTSSWAQSVSQALTASYTPNAIVTASVSSNVLTFTKGNGTTFNLTVNTGSGGGGSTLPGGSDTYVQFNSASSFGGNNGFTYDYNTKTVTTEKLKINSGVELKNASIVDDNNTPYTAAAVESIFLCNTINASVDIDLSACQVDGRIVIVKDIGGNANNNFITFPNTIDNSSYQLDNPYQGITMIYSQAAGFWCIIGEKK